MSNIFLDLPMPAGEGAGASVDTSTMGKNKSITLAGDFGGGAVSVQASMDGATFFSIKTLTRSGRIQIPLIAQFMRVFVQDRGSSFSVNADVGADDSGATFVTLPLPAGDGAGAPVDVSALGTFTTFTVDGAFEGSSVAIEISEDGVDYVSAGVHFASYGGLRSKDVVANWMRTFVRNRGPSFGAVVAVGAGDDALTQTGGALVDATRTYHEPTITPESGNNSPGQQPDLALIGTTVVAQFTIATDSAYRIFKVPSNYVTDAAFHVHWTKEEGIQGDSDESGNAVRWRLSYTVSPGNGADINVAPTVIEIEDTYDDAGTTTRTMYRTADIAAPGFIAGYYVAICIEAIAPVGGPALTCEPALVTADLTYTEYINQ